MAPALPRKKIPPERGPRPEHDCCLFSLCFAGERDDFVTVRSLAQPRVFFTAASAIGHQ